MAQKRLPVRNIREILRPKATGVSERKIASAVSCARPSVQVWLQTARNAGLSWPLPDNLDEAALAALFFKEAPSSTAHPEGWQYSVFCDRYRRWLVTRDPVL